jgi:NitT/TauT family transport system substrate-binding protein
MRKLVVLVMLVGLLACSGCRAKEPATLKIGVLPITDVVPMYVAQQEGYFADEGLAVELLPVASGPERDSMIQAGVIDGELNEILTTVLTNAGAGEQVRIVTTARRPFPNAPMFYILSSPNSGITTPAQLGGVEIGISGNTVIEYVTERVLENAGLAADEILGANIPKIPVRLELLLGDQIQAGVLPDPLASLSLAQGAHLVIDDTTYPEVAISVISFREKVLKERPDAVEAFLRAYDRAVEAINENPQQFQNILIETARVPEVLQDRYTLPPFPEHELPTEHQVQDVVDWALSKGLIGETLAYDQVVDATFRR